MASVKRSDRRHTVDVNEIQDAVSQLRFVGQVNILKLRVRGQGGKGSQISDITFHWDIEQTIRPLFQPALAVFCGGFAVLLGQVDTNTVLPEPTVRFEPTIMCSGFA